ncbi:glycosyltransferase family 9 protein, partial [Candidatus Woesearchaeota archaeon]|nr:glycosyltransferase family 9 protein [Candidatus Woesearchaeota archaeon]
MKILIIKLGAIWDVIRTTSILPGLREKYSNPEIYWATKKQCYGILKNIKEIKKIFLIEDDFDGICKIKYDMVISLDDDTEACTLASSVNSGKIIGSYLKDGSKVYTGDSSQWFDTGLISRHGKEKADQLKAENRKTYQEIMYGILGLNYKKQEPVLELSSVELEFGKKFSIKNNLKDGDLVIGINTGAGGRWQDKKLSIEKTAKLIDNLNRDVKNARILLFGGPEEKERNQKIKELAKSDITDAGCDNSLMEFASLINLCSVLVTSDSLALNVGVALKKKIVVFFCPTSPWEIELYNRGIKIIPKKGCVCCYKPKCDITPDYDVYEIAD